MTSQISLLLPTRGRPASIRRVVESAASSAVHPERLEFCFRIDEDDPESALAVESVSKESPCTILQTVAERAEISNRLWLQAFEVSNGEILMVAADDIVFRTPGWDERVAAAFAEYPDRIVMVQTDDGHWPPGHEICSHPFIHRTWTDITGHFVPNIPAMGVDECIFRVADAIGRRHPIDAVIEHLHHSAGKAERDRTYQERDQLVSEQWAAVKVPAQELFDQMLGEDIARLRAAINGS